MGHQETIEEMRAEKAEKFKELANKKGTPEYDAWFLRYRPSDNKAEKKAKDLDKEKANGDKDLDKDLDKASTISKPKTKSKRKKNKKTKTKKTGFFF